MIKNQVTMKLKKTLTQIESVSAENGNKKWKLLKEAPMHTCNTTNTQT